ncbi:MAG: GTP-binding protein [Planctomycetes bacterium]|nr:GTP-binding protein [Planctomycetota bacterium]
MKTLAAVMTGSGTSAIATLEVLGPGAHDILSRLFTPCGPAPLKYQIGAIRIGTLHDDQHPIDQITVGCEGQHHWALHCHGNPLIVEAAMALLKAQGATLVGAEDIRAQQLSGQDLSTCQQEAHLAMAHCKTLLGAQVLNHQTQGGLANWSLTWQRNTQGCHQDLRAQCRVILSESRIADRILNGVTAALVGPPNSGKSTLLNSLSGQDAALVTDVRGTTRDWIEANCRTSRLALHLIDTAGLDTTLQEAPLDAESQHRTLDVMDRAQIIFLVLDASQPAAQIESHWFGDFPDVPCLTVLNKADQPALLTLKDLDRDPASVVSVSAKQETGLNELLDQVERTLGITDFNITQPLCITPRQCNNVEQILAAPSLSQALSHLGSLRHAR